MRVLAGRALSRGSSKIGEAGRAPVATPQPLLRVELPFLVGTERVRQCRLFPEPSEGRRQEGPRSRRARRCLLSWNWLRTRTSALPLARSFGRPNNALWVPPIALTTQKESGYCLRSVEAMFPCGYFSTNRSIKSLRPSGSLSRFLLCWSGERSSVRTSQIEEGIP